MTNDTKDKTRFNTVARIVADCPHCGDLCEIDDLKNNGFSGDSEHCCMKCGNHLYFDAGGKSETEKVESASTNKKEQFTATIDVGRFLNTSLDGMSWLLADTIIEQVGGPLAFVEMHNKVGFDGSNGAIKGFNTDKELAGFYKKSEKDLAKFLTDYDVKENNKSEDEASALHPIVERVQDEYGDNIDDYPQSLIVRHSCYIALEHLCSLYAGFKN